MVVNPTAQDEMMIDLLENAPHCLSVSTTRDGSPLPLSPVPLRSPRTKLSAKQITKLAECRHFHFASVELGPIGLQVEDVLDGRWKLRIESNGESWTIDRSWEEIVEFDQQLHRCIFERRHSKLTELENLQEGVEGSSAESPSSSSSEMPSSSKKETLRRVLDTYLARLSRLTGSLITCYPVLKFLEVDSRGRHFSPPEMSAINTPAIAAAIVTKEFIASSPDHLTIRVGDIISIIEMCSRAQNNATWWKAKLTISAGRGVQPMEDENQNTFKIGYFPSNCVQLFEDKGPQHSPPSSHKVSAARRVSELLRRGVRKRNPVFGTDLETHLERANRKVPLILERCVAAIEKHGIVTGIYRQCGIQSNIQRLRAKFDSGADPDLFEFAIVRDVYCVSSLLKQYFRQLPNPLFTFQLYSTLVAAFDSPTQSEKVRALRIAMQMLPAAHYNSARFLLKHLSRLCEHTALTDMTSRNLAIVWAPNLFRAPPMMNGHDSHLLNGLNVHTSLCNFLIEHTSEIFPEAVKQDGISKSLTTSNLTASPVLSKRHRSFHEFHDSEDSLSRRSDFQWSRVFRGKSVDGLIGGFANRRRTINGSDNGRRRQDEIREEGPVDDLREVKWRRSHSTDAAFRAARSESIISIITKGYEEIRDGVRSWTKRAYSLRPRSRPPPSLQMASRPRIERMHESVTLSTVSRASDDALDNNFYYVNEIKEEETPQSSCSSSLKDVFTAKERRVAFRSHVQDCYPDIPDIPLGERSSPVEEWSSESRNSPLLEMSRYDNVSPARPREHVIDRMVAGFDLPPPAESPLLLNGKTSPSV